MRKPRIVSALVVLGALLCGAAAPAPDLRLIYGSQISGEIEPCG